MASTWELLDHMCRHCGGRVVKQVTGGTPSGGGNPLYMCSLCGEGSCAMGPDVVCWCGSAFRGGEPGAFHCVATKAAETDPDLATALANCGTSPYRNKYQLQVGIVGTADYRRLARKQEGLDE